MTSFSAFTRLFDRPFPAGAPGFRGFRLLGYLILINLSRSLIITKLRNKVLIRLGGKRFAPGMDRYENKRSS